MTGLRPFWRYYGGKWRITPRYPKPRHRTIIEPFAGAAGYSLRYPDHDVVLVEKYHVIAEIWRWLIAATPDEIRAIPCVDVRLGEGYEASRQPRGDLVAGLGARAGIAAATRALAQRRALMAESQDMNAAKLMQMFLTAAHHQIIASAEGKAILEAGLGAQLHELMHSTAANAAQPIMTEIEEMVQAALGVTAG